VLITVGTQLLLAAAVWWVWLRPEVSTTPPAKRTAPPRTQPRAAGAAKGVTPMPTAPKKDPAPTPPPVKTPPQLLRDTVVVPTLDTPIPAGKSVVWCASFQMAWDRLKAFAQEPIRLEGADDLAGRLNRTGFPAEAVVPENSYTVAGKYSEGVVGEIRKEMARRFPGAKLPALEEVRHGVLVFAYLQSKVRFAIPFLNHVEGIEFRDSQGHSVRVAAFGPQAPPLRFSKAKRPDEGEFQRLREKAETMKRLRAQVEILYVRLSKEEKAVDFAVDPHKDSSPDQLVLARIDRKGTLAETLADLEKMIASSATRDSEYGMLIPGDQLWIPVLSLDVEHRFRELEGRERQFGNKRMRGLFLDTAAQTLRFRLDANGAELASSGRARVAKGRPTQHFVFDRPFLLYVKKRGAKQPFLVMWIDNSGLMLPREAAPGGEG
jgi:hypothetical protein